MLCRVKQLSIQALCLGIRSKLFIGGSVPERIILRGVRQIPLITYFECIAAILSYHADMREKPSGKNINIH